MPETGLIPPVFRRAALPVLIVLVSGVTPAAARAQVASAPDKMSYGRFQGEPAPPLVRLAVLLQQIRWDTRRAGDLNPDGLRLRFERLPLQANEAPEPARYRVFAEGAPENKVYTLGVWLVGKQIAYRRENLYVNAQGLLMVHRPTPEQESAMKAPGDELILTPDAATAEPIRYILGSLDEQLSIQGTLVPHPLVGEDQECTLEARIAEPEAAAILIVADGFPGDARLSLVLESEGNTAHLALHTDPSGHAEVVDFPSVPGKTQGTLLVTAEASDCLPAVRVPWGTAISAKAP